MVDPVFHVLLVEDNPVDAKVETQRTRRALGPSTEVVHVTSVAGATAALARPEPFDVVLLDLDVTDSTGVETLRRTQAAAPDVAIVALTGAIDNATAIDALQGGAQDYLMKPCTDVELLSRTLRYAVERSRAQRDRAAMGAQLQQAQRLEGLGQLAAGIAHEINTPIQFIGDNCRFVLDSITDLKRWIVAVESLVVAARGCPGTEPASRAVDDARAAVSVDYLVDEMPKAMSQALEGLDRVAGIVRAMKQFAHPGTERAAVRLNDLLEKTLTISRNEWKYCARIEVSFDDSLPELEAQPGELGQVFLNLVVNAAHAIAGRPSALAAAPGVITIRTRRESEHAVVEISDNGIGIPAAIRHKIYTPFFTTKEPGKGTGQGLPIARRVVLNHGGTIDFDSVEGQGTTFTIRLPLSARRPTADPTLTRS